MSRSPLIFSEREVRRQAELAGLSVEQLADRGVVIDPELPTFVDMRQFTEDGAIGDCWRACVATLAYRTSDDVPHFVEQYEGDWLYETNTWLREQLGKELVCTQPEFPITWADTRWLPMIAVGRSERGHGHAVLIDGNSGGMIHDPHPSRAGLVSIEAVFVLQGK